MLAFDINIIKRIISNSKLELLNTEALFDFLLENWT